MKLTLKSQKLAFGALVSCALLVTMGASCDLKPSVSNPITDVPRDVNEVIDAHRKAGKDVTDWGSKFADGWNKSSTARSKGQCKPWKILCQGAK